MSYPSNEEQGQSIAESYRKIIDDCSYAGTITMAVAEMDKLLQYIENLEEKLAAKEIKENTLYPVPLATLAEVLLDGQEAPTTL